MGNAIGLRGRNVYIYRGLAELEMKEEEEAKRQR